MSGGVIVYGSQKQMLDLQYVFKNVKIHDYSQNPKDILHFLKYGGRAILCKKQKPDISPKLNYEQYDWDDELIKTLNCSLNKESCGKRVVIWGTGKICANFEQECQQLKEVTIYGYVDSDKEKVGNKRRSLPILDPMQINPSDYYVIIATNLINYIEIKNQLKEIGFTDGYIYYRTLIDDLAVYFKKTYESNVYFPTVKCPNKDNSVRIRQNGDLCTCCMSYESILGNLFEQEFEEAWNSKRALISRLAIENRTYVNCDKKRCPFLSGIKPETLTNNIQISWNYKENSRQYPDSIAPEVDCSCNLYCKSCRDKIFIEDSPQVAAFTELIIKKLVNLPVRFIINTVGEPFSSKYCKSILYHEKTKHRKNISLYTNGILLTPNVLDKLLENYFSIEIAVSMDAATKTTYEQLRRNGNFDILCKNLEYISVKRKENRVSYLQLNYVLQICNIAEMEKFIIYAKKLGSDRIAINAIENWGHMSAEEYGEVSIIENGKLKAGLEQYFLKEYITDDIINFHNLSNFIGARPRLMYMI